jgi:hypothetical protein
MTLLINASAVPFSDADQRTICHLGVGMSSRPNGRDCSVGRLVGRCVSRREVASRYRVPTKTPAEWASKGTGPTQGGPDLRAFSESRRITRTHFRGSSRS